jgi:hypothetical protein
MDIVLKDSEEYKKAANKINKVVLMLKYIDNNSDQNNIIEKSIKERLDELDDLKAQNIITDKEHEDKRTAIINEM